MYIHNVCMGVCWCHCERWKSGGNFPGVGSFFPEGSNLGHEACVSSTFAHQAVLPAHEHTTLINSFTCIYIFSFIAVILSEICLFIVMFIIELWALHRLGKHPTMTASFFIGRGHLGELVRLALYSPYSPGRCQA